MRNINWGLSKPEEPRSRGENPYTKKWHESLMYILEGHKEPVKGQVVG